MKRYFTEFLGTFFLVLIIVLSIAGGSPLTPLVVGAGLMAAVYMGGHISGAHYNPAVTLAVALRGKCPWTDVLPYWAAQLIGGTIAALTAAWLCGRPYNIGPRTELLHAYGPAAPLVAECAFTLLLCLVVLNVATTAKTAGNSYFGLAIGFTVFVGASAAGPISGGALNPAVGIALWLVGSLYASVFNFSVVWIYLIGPLAGGVLAALIYRVQNPEEFTSK